MPVAELGPLRMFYTDEGAGDAVLLVHGWSCDSHDWSWQIPAFAERHRVIAADNRGHGRSSVPPIGYDPNTFASDLRELLIALDVGPVVAIGHSLGGLIVSTMAVEYPELIRAVVAVDPSYGIDPAIRSSVERTIAGLRGPTGADVVPAMLARMEAAVTPPALATWHRRRVLGTPPQVVADTLAGLFESHVVFRPESEQYLKGRVCPVLAIHADADRAAGEATTFQHPHSRHVGWDTAGHWLHQERPDEFNGLVLDWIASVRGN